MTIPIEQMAVKWAGRPTLTPFRTLDQDMADTFNVMDFGAKGDGSSDDTAAINACLAAAFAYGITTSVCINGSVVKFPAGAYKVLSTISMASHTGGSVKIEGAGPKNTLILGNIPDGYILDKPDVVADTLMSIRDLGIYNQNYDAGKKLTIAAATWSGGVTTYTTNELLTTMGWTTNATTRNINIVRLGDARPDGGSGINPTTFGGNNLVGTRTGTNTFTITMSNPGGSSVTCTSASPGVFTWTGNSLVIGSRVTLAGTAVPTGFTAGTVYYVVAASFSAGSTFTLSATLGGTAINTSSTGTSVTATAWFSGGIVYMLSGALRFNYTGSSELMNLDLAGFISLDSTADAFPSCLFNIHCTGPGENEPVGSVGIATCGGQLIACNVLGCDTGYLIGGMTQGANAGSPGTNLIGCRAEVCTHGYNIGVNLLGHTSNAGVAMIGCQSERCYETIVVSGAAPIHIIGGSFTGTRAPAHYFHISAGGSLVWSSGSGGQATVTMPPTVPSLNELGWTSGTRQIYMEGAVPTNSLTITSAVYNSGTGLITYGSSNPLTDISWSTNGTTRIISVTSIDPPAMQVVGATGTRTDANHFTVPITDPGDLYNSGGVGTIYPGYNTGFTHVTATWTSATTFTYPVAVDPGGPNTADFADWSFMCQSAIKFLSAQAGLITGVGMGFIDPEVGYIDMGSFDGGLITFQGTMTTNLTNSTYQNIVLPAGSKKAGIFFDNCGINKSMVFADLPGQPGVWVNAQLGGPIEGMEYDIIDANLVTVGTGSASSITGSVLTVGGTIGGQGFSIGDTLSGTGVTSGTKIISYASATTYNILPNHVTPTGSITITASNIPFGSIISAGGGSTHAMVRYNGTNWTCMGT